MAPGGPSPHSHSQRTASEEYFYMKNKEEALFLYIVFKRRQKLNQNSWGRGRDKDFIVLKSPMTKDSRKGTVVNPQVLVSL